MNGRLRARPFLFDCDGVLVNSEVIAVATERAHLAQAGLSYSAVQFVSRFTGLTQAAFSAALEADSVARLGRPPPAGLFAAIKADVKARYPAELRAIGGIRDVLDGLSGPRAVASSSERDILHVKLRLVGLHGDFDPHIHSGDDVANGKPAPDLFLRAACGLGVNPGDCVVVEDSVHGVRAGVAAGAAVWGFTGGGHADAGLAGRLRAAGASLVFGDFAAMAAHVATSE
ncbi:MAG: HAD family hydrolase [Caulobacterales bacterium]